MTVPERLTEILAPHLGAYSAESVSVHLCAKYRVEAGLTPDKVEQLRDFLRRGLVAYVGAEAAERLAEECAQALRASPAG